MKLMLSFERPFFNKLNIVDGVKQNPVLTYSETDRLSVYNAVAAEPVDQSS